MVGCYSGPLVVKALDESTWPAFAALVERNNGVWGGCWCMGFHPEGVGKHKTPAQNRAEKEARVRAGTAHAALVFDGGAAEGGPCVGWCQFGPTEELPRIKHAKAYTKGLELLPRWRITCFFVDRDHRRRGVAAAALRGAVSEIARLGGGVVESYPEVIGGRTKVSGSFLHNATAELFEREGFERTRQLGKHCWVVRREVAPA